MSNLTPHRYLAQVIASGIPQRSTRFPLGLLSQVPEEMKQKGKEELQRENTEEDEGKSPLRMRS